MAARISALTLGDGPIILLAIRSTGGRELKRSRLTLHDNAVLSRLTLVALRVAIGLGLLAPLVVLAQTPAGAVVRAVSVQRTVEARRAGQTTWQAVRLNDKVSPGDTIRRIGQRSRADIALLHQSVMRLNANTELTVEPVKDESTLLTVFERTG